MTRSKAHTSWCSPLVAAAPGGGRVAAKGWVVQQHHHQMRGRKLLDGLKVHRYFQNWLYHFIHIGPIVVVVLCIWDEVGKGLIHGLVFRWTDQIRSVHNPVLFYVND